MASAAGGRLKSSAEALIPTGSGVRFVGSYELGVMVVGWRYRQSALVL